MAAFGRAYGLTLVESSTARRTVRMEGTAEQVSRAFAVELGYYESGERGRYRGRRADVHVPGASWPALSRESFGLDNRRMARLRRSSRRTPRAGLRT